MFYGSRVVGVCFSFWFQVRSASWTPSDVLGFTRTFLNNLNWDLIQSWGRGIFGFRFRCVFACFSLTPYFKLVRTRNLIFLNFCGHPFRADVGDWRPGYWGPYYKTVGLTILFGALFFSLPIGRELSFRYSLARISCWHNINHT